MTVTYSLTRGELVRSFFQSLLSSQRFRLLIFVYTAAIGLFSLVMRGFLWSKVTTGDALMALAWMGGAVCFMPLWLLVRGNRGKRTLTIAADGITTEIASVKGFLPWRRVKGVEDDGQYIFLIGRSGNAFIVPRRAFDGTARRQEFIAQIADWRRG